MPFLAQGVYFLVRPSAGAHEEQRPLERDSDNQNLNILIINIIDVIIDIGCIDCSDRATES